MFKRLNEQLKRYINEDKEYTVIEAKGYDSFEEYTLHANNDAHAFYQVAFKDGKQAYEYIQNAINDPESIELDAKAARTLGRVFAQVQKTLDMSVMLELYMMDRSEFNQGLEYGAGYDMIVKIEDPDGNVVFEDSDLIDEYLDYRAEMYGDEDEEDLDEAIDLRKQKAQDRLAWALTKATLQAHYNEVAGHFEKFVGDAQGEHVCKIYVKEGNLEFVNGDIIKNFPVKNTKDIEKAFKEIAKLEK